MKLLTTILFVAFAAFVSCSKPPEKDPRVEQLQEEVRKLSKQNQSLESEIRKLQTQSTEIERELDQQKQQPQTSPKMTVDRMKNEIKPALDEAIAKVKSKAETPRKGTQFGMRVEYDLKKAFYGLIQTNNPQVPYQAKVIVTYEKFLESEQESKSYGAGTTMLMFSYKKNRWVLDRTE